MATSDKKNLMGYDPLAWMGENTEDLVIENLVMAAEAEEELLVVSDSDMCQDDAVALSDSANDHEFLEPDNSEIEMNTVADIPDDLVSDAPEMEAAVESIINLDAILTIQHVVKLHEKLKQSYAANNTVEINASQVSSIDTASLQLLVALKQNANKQQKAIVFSSPSMRFIESAELLGLLDILDIDV
jgi:anti-anti-sigma regulatory factor